MNKNIINILRFSKKYPGWHSYSNDKLTKRIVNKAYKSGLIDVDFRLGMFTGK